MPLYLISDAEGRELKYLYTISPTASKSPVYLSHHAVDYHQIIGNSSSLEGKIVSGPSRASLQAALALDRNLRLSKRLKRMINISNGHKSTFRRIRMQRGIHVTAYIRWKPRSSHDHLRQAIEYQNLPTALLLLKSQVTAGGIDLEPMRALRLRGQYHFSALSCLLPSSFSLFPKAFLSLAYYCDKAPSLLCICY